MLSDLAESKGFAVAVVINRAAGLLCRFGQLVVQVLRVLPGGRQIDGVEIVPI